MWRDVTLSLIQRVKGFQGGAPFWKPFTLCIRGVLPQAMHLLYTPLPRARPDTYQVEGGGGGTTGGRSLQVIVFGSSQGASQGPVVPPPVLPPRSVTLNSEPADVKWKEPQLLMPTAPTLRAT